MTAWTAERVQRAAADWVWLPDGAEQRLTEDYQVIAYPDHFHGMATQVAWCRSDRPARP